MDVPVVAAAWLKSHVGEDYLLIRYGCEITVAREIFGICRIGLSDGENHFSLECRLGVIAGDVVIPYFFGEAEGCPGFGSSGIKRYVGDDLSCLCARDPVFLR